MATYKTPPVHNNAEYLRSLVRFLDARPEFMNDGKSIETLVNEYATRTDHYPVPVKPIRYSKAVVRKDLTEPYLGVPVGDGYYFGSNPLKYRWVTERCFQVYLDGKWQEAISLDWDF